MMATATKGNELVVYVTQNEPNNGNPAVNPMVRGIYDAVRSTGNNTLIIIGPDNPFGNAALQESTVAGMKNVAMTLHFYNWVTGYSMDLGANEAELAKEVANHGLSLCRRDHAGPGGGVWRRHRWVQGRPGLESRHHCRA